MNQDIHNFIQYLHQEKQASENTEVSYERDLKKMILYLTAHGVSLWIQNVNYLFCHNLYNC